MSWKALFSPTFIDDHEIRETRTPKWYIDTQSKEVMITVADDNTEGFLKDVIKRGGVSYDSKNYKDESHAVVVLKKDGGCTS